jgi:hypothetical protein
LFPLYQETVAVAVVFHFFFIFLLGEIFFAPEVAAERSFVDAAWVDDDAGGVAWFEVGMAEIEGRGLQGVEEEAGGFGVHLTAGEEAYDLHEADLDGVGILENGKIERGADAPGTGGVEGDALFVPALMEKAEAIASQRRRATLGTVNFDVLTTRNLRQVIHDECSTPSPSGLVESESWRENMIKIFEE